MTYTPPLASSSGGAEGIDPRFIVQSSAYIATEGDATPVQVSTATAADALKAGLELMTASATPTAGLNTLLDVTGPGELVAFVSPKFKGTAGREAELIITVDGVAHTVDPEAVARGSDCVVALLCATSILTGSESGVSAMPCDYSGGKGLVFSSSLKIEANFTGTTYEWSDEDWVYCLREASGW